jgi:hypothetical protein
MIQFHFQHFPLNQRHYLLIKLYLRRPATVPESVIKYFKAALRVEGIQARRNAVNFFMLFRLTVIEVLFRAEKELEGVFYANNHNYECLCFANES